MSDPTSAFRITERDVREAFIVAVATEDQRMQWLDSAVDSQMLRPRLIPHYDPTMASSVAVQVNEYVVEQGGVTAVSLALTAILVSSKPVIAFQWAHAEGNKTVKFNMTQRLAIHAAYALTNLMAIRSGLTTAPMERDAFVSLLEPNSPFIAEIVRFIVSQLVDETPIPVVAVLTPLSQLNRTEQSQLLRVATAIRDAIPATAARVLIPGEGLNPDMAIDSSPSSLYASEREILLHASVVVVIAANHDSWGAAHSIAWCETNGADVVVFMDDATKLSRVLGSRPYGTDVRPDRDAAAIAKFVASRFAERQQEYRDHAHDTAQTARRMRGMLNRLKELSERTITVGRFPRLNSDRLKAALSAPWELDALTARELRALGKEMGEEGWSLIRSLLEFPLPKESLTELELLQREAEEDL